MKRKKETFVLLLIIAALSLYLFYRKEDKTHYQLPELTGIDTGEITRLTIQKGDLEHTLQQENDQWVILPQGYPADTAPIEKMLEMIEGLSLTALASEAGNDSIFDLDEAQRIRVAVFKGDDLLREVDIGKTAPSQRHTFVKLKDDKRIYHAEENFRNPFDKDLQALRDKQVMKIDQEVSEVLLESGDNSLLILRAAEPVPEPVEVEEGQSAPETLTWQTDEGKNVKEKEIDSLVKTLSNLKCDGYVEEKNKEDYMKPSFKVTLKGLQDHTLELYEKQDGKFVCISSENDYPFLIPEWKAKKIQLDLDTLIEN